MILLSTGTLNTLGLSRIFALAAEAGFDGVEIMVDGRLDTRDARYLRRLSSDYGLPIAVVHSPFLPDVEGWPADQLGRLERTLALAGELGVGLVVTHLPYRLYLMWIGATGPRSFRFTAPLPWLRREPYYALLRDGGLAALEEETGITIAVENMPARRYLGRLWRLYWFNTPDEMRRFPHLTLDTTHLGTWGLDPVAVYGQLQDHVVHVHLSNFAGGKEHRAPTDGDLALGEFLQALARNGYAGAVSVESEPNAFHADDEAACLAELRAALAFCREHIGRASMQGCPS
ncbi:MAG: sugar phosphate isomerase/epimerase [Anaerolineae bacterium]|nr:sugar phosphate isomerase/epimerase [Anaerolineae bacterium]